MSQLIEFRPRAALAALAWLLAALALSPAVAAAPFGVPDETAEALVADLSERYEVLTLSRGYVARPLADAGFELIEVLEDGVLVDGEPRGLDELRDAVGEDAELLVALTGDAAALASLAERQRLAERDEAAREIEESIRQQAEELERLDSERLRELNETLDRQRRRRARPVRSETRVSLGSSLTIDEDESASDVVVLLGPLDVRGEVRGDTVVVLGSVEVTGEIGGDLTVVGGKVSIGPEAEVDGEVICVGGAVHRAPGARVNGEITEVSFSPFLNVDLPGIDFQGWWPFRDWRANRYGFRWFEFMGSIFSTVLLAIIVLFIVTVARRRVAAIAERASSEPWKSGLVGFVVEVLVAPIVMLISLLLIVSVVGIPVLLVLLPLTVLALLVFFFLGYAGVAVALGQTTVRGRFDPHQLSPFVAVLIGLVLIQIWQIFGEGLSFTGGLITFSGYLLIAFGFFLKYLVWTVGLGAVVLDRFSPLPQQDEPQLPWRGTNEPQFIPPPPPDFEPLPAFITADTATADGVTADEMARDDGAGAPDSDQETVEDSNEPEEDPDEIYRQVGGKSRKAKADEDGST